MESVKRKSTVRTFKDLIVWQKAHLLVLGIYKVTKSFPSEEKFGLASQLRRSAASVPTNSEFMQLSNLCDEVGRMLSGLQRSLPVFN